MPVDRSPSPLDDPRFPSVLEKLSEGAGRLDAGTDSLERSLRILREGGIDGWVVPERFGGADITPIDLLRGYVRLSEACLTTAFVLTQRNGACQRIAASSNVALQQELLPPLCRGDLFATVGISHLTTSRQFLARPAVRAVESPGAITLDGYVPWVTAGSLADYIVTGGTMDDGRQILAAVPTTAEGVDVQPPQRLLALTSSLTGAVALHGVRIDARFLLAGPTPQVMKQGTGAGTGSLSTSALAVGVSRAALALLRSESEKRPELEEIRRPLDDEIATLESDLTTAASATEGTVPAPSLTADAIRQRANGLVLRATQAAMAASKGAGFVAGHPAERLAREALFFLVWSCPQPVVAATLRGLVQSVSPNACE